MSLKDIERFEPRATMPDDIIDQHGFVPQEQSGPEQRDSTHRQRDRHQDFKSRGRGQGQQRQGQDKKGGDQKRQQNTRHNKDANAMNNKMLAIVTCIKKIQQSFRKFQSMRCLSLN